jgi:hypothetical protein
MAKIVVLADGADADAAKTALGDAGIDFEVVKPTAANLLHIAIGMVDDNDDADEESAPEEEPAEEPAPEETPAEEPAPEEGVEESLGQVRIGGELIEAVATTDSKTTLFVQGLAEGLHTTFAINESAFGVWAIDGQVMLSDVSFNDSPIQAISVSIAEAKTQPMLKVGTDLIHLFKA